MGPQGQRVLLSCPYTLQRPSHVAKCLALGRVGQGRAGDKAWRLDLRDSKVKGERKGFSSRLNVNKPRARGFSFFQKQLGSIQEVFNKCCWPQPRVWVGLRGMGRYCRRAAAGRAPGAWERHLQSSRSPGQALSIKHRQKRKLKGKGQAPSGVVGIPVTSNLVRRVGDLPPEA